MYATKDFPKCGFGHCFGFQYVPSVFQLLGILATFFGGIGLCFHWKLGFLPWFSGLSQATPAWKGRASDGKCGSNAKGKQTEEGALRKQRETYGKYTETLTGCEVGDGYIRCWKVRKATERVQCKVETCLPSIQDAPSFGECIQLAGENWNLEDEFPFVKVQFGRGHVNGVCHSENSRLLS